MDCMIVGDSIAVGTHQFAPHCHLQGRGGINTWQFNKQFPGIFQAHTVIISLGTNDHQYIKTAQELERMRLRVKAQRVCWILPAANLPASKVPIENIQKWVRDLAQKQGDMVIPIRYLQRDQIHPSWSGYRDLIDQCG